MLNAIFQMGRLLRLLEFGQFPTVVRRKLRLRGSPSEGHGTNNHNAVPKSISARDNRPDGTDPKKKTFSRQITKKCRVSSKTIII